MPMPVPSSLSQADDDLVLVPAEGLVKLGIALPDPLSRRLRALVRHDVARLVRARARLVLALALTPSADRPHLEDDVARVARGTDARALVAGQALVSGWPTLSDRENPPMLDDLVAVLRACQVHDDPRAALPSVCQLLLTRLRASAVLVAGATAHGTIALARLGQRDLTAVAERAAHLGQSVVACESGATDCAIPVRLGDVVVGSLAATGPCPSRDSSRATVRCSRRRRSRWRRLCVWRSNWPTGLSLAPSLRVCLARVRRWPSSAPLWSRHRACRSPCLWRAKAEAARNW